MAALLFDLVVFVEILLYWALVLVVMAPLALVDRVFGTRLVTPLDRLTRVIARL